MENLNNLTELIEQAAGKIPLLDPKDSGELKEFADLFKKMESALQTLGDCAQQPRIQIESLTRAGADQIEKLLQEDCQAAEQALADLSGFITGLQTLTETLLTDPGDTAPAPQAPAATVQEAPAEPANAEKQSPQQILIPPDDLPLVQDFIAESREHIESAETALLNLENQPDNEETLNQIFRGFHTIKGMAGFLNLTPINRLAHVSENLLDQARKRKLVLTGASSNLAFASIDLLKFMLKVLEDVISRNAPFTFPEALEPLIAQIQLAVEGKGQSEPAPVPMTPGQDAQLEPILKSDPEPGREQAQAPASSSASSSAAAAAQEKIKVSTKRLDDLVNMTGELAVAQLMISEEVNKTCHTDSDLFRKVALQSKIVRELQELSMAMRMIPVQGAFQKMARLVRDLSKKAGKEIDFQTVGEETELDRTIVDKITDPLIHMIRNSVDHGLETPQERTQKGKSPHGRIRLAAAHQAGSILIEIQDDGRGLNREKILKKAIEKGMISENHDLSEEDIFALIFRPGFSTAEKVTEVSGRGVGMDVVRKNIDSLNGKIQIASTPDQGTTFTIRLPLTLAIIDGQIVTIGSQRYIIPINSVVQSLRPATEQISTIQNRSRVVMIRGQLHPLIPLYKLFSVPDAVREPEQALLVVVGEGNKKCCLQVDDLQGQQQVVIKSLKGLGKIRGISGGAIMGDGQISLILDVPGLIELACNQSECP